ncbi:MAG TPA: S53 family peptidase [Capillimicrobium sp.]|nr:S53 family peptidase [Capillimicrobium sp.]
MPLTARKPLAALLTATVAGAAAAAVAPAAATATAAAVPNVDVLLELRHERGLHRFVRAVSDPTSPRYRQHRSIEQLVARYGASKADRRAATRWLAGQGLEASTGVDGTFLTVHTDAATAAELFPAPAGARAKVTTDAGATRAAAVPAALDGVVTGATVLDTAPVYRGAATTRQAPAEQLQLPTKHGSLRTRTGTPAGCAAATGTSPGMPFAAFTPNQYLEAYGHADLHRRGLTGKGVRMALIEIDGFDPQDIATFAACFDKRVPPIHAHAVGMKKLLPPGDETTLDLEVIVAAAPGLEAIDVYEGGASAADLLQTLRGALADPKTRPDVISMSLGQCEATMFDATQQAKAMNMLLALAAGSGITTVASAGDQGSTACSADHGNSAIPVVNVNFPASSPYVTGVGGTNLTLDAKNRIVDEITWNDSPAIFAGTGGGLSLVNDRPWWQRGDGLRPGANSGIARVVPDVAALADLIPGYAIYCTAAGACTSKDAPAGGWTSVGGTSAAAPLTGAAFALMDEAARRKGQGDLGLVNPLIYRLGQAKSPVYTDVTSGNNDLGAMIPAAAYGGSPAGCCPASKGYDPVTGWGSIKVDAFNDAALAAGRR